MSGQRKSSRFVSAFFRERPRSGDVPAFRQEANDSPPRQRSEYQVRAAGELVIAYKHLSEWPSGVMNLASVRTLHLEYNLFEHFPEELRSMSASLERLYLNNNRLSGPLSIAIGVLLRLLELHLGCNQLQSLP